MSSIGLSMDGIKELLNLGYGTIQHVANRLDKYEECFRLIKNRSKRVEKEFKKKHTCFEEDLKRSLKKFKNIPVLEEKMLNVNSSTLVKESR